MFFENKKEKKEAAIKAQESSEKTSPVQITCWYRTNEDLRIPKIIPPIREY
jgi:hypothetical protein